MQEHQNEYMENLTNLGLIEFDHLLQNIHKQLKIISGLKDFNFFIKFIKSFPTFINLQLYLFFSTL